MTSSSSSTSTLPSSPFTMRTINPFFRDEPFTTWKFNKVDNDNSDNDDKTSHDKLKKVKMIVNIHIMSLIFYFILFGVYLGFSLGYEPKVNHLIPISFDVGTFNSNNGWPFNHNILIPRSYTYQLWIPLVVMLSIVIVFQLYPIILYYYKNRQLNYKRNNNYNNNDNTDNQSLKTDFFYDMVTMGINLHLWIEHALVTGILLFVAAGVIGISNIILLLFFAITALFIGVICLYTHELLSAGYILNSTNELSSSSPSSMFKNMMNWIPLLFGFILTLLYLGPFITYYALSNLSTLGSSAWFVWVFGIGVISMIFTMNLIPLITYIYINYLISYPIHKNQKNKTMITMMNQENKTKQIQNVLYGYTIIKMVWLLLTITFAIITAFVSIFV